MNTQKQIQTGIRLPENLIIQLKKRARNHGISFNAYVQYLLTKDVNNDIPYIDPDDKISPALLSMAGTIIVPPQEELESDPRLASVFGLSATHE
jgi:hypothetical protein